MRSKLPHLPRRHRLTPLAHAVALGCLLAAPLWLHAQTGPRGLPSGLQVIQGQASVATQGTQMTVKNSAGAILNWQSFSIGAASGVHFEQASTASKVLNRVVGSDPSAIFGSLTSNGQVWLLNPNGVLFGQGARVDVGGLVTSTLRLNDNDFLAGRYRFSAAAGDSAGVRNEGSIASSFGGHVVLLGEHVENTGRIAAPGGSVGLAAARSVELVDTGLPNLTVKVNVPAGEVLNLGALAAAGGSIDVYAGIVNQQGLVQADTLGADAQGRIVLHAADTLTLGPDSRTLARGAAAGAAGGAVDLLGAQVGVLGQALVDVSGSAAGGSLRLGGGEQGQDRSVPNARAVYVGPEATLRADATGDTGRGGRIVLWSNEATRAYGVFSARGGSAGGDGGFVETSGGWLDARPAAVDVSARDGRAGTWLLDPNNILINNAGPNTNVSGGPVFTSTNDNSVIGVASIAAALNAGTSVTVATGTGGTNSQPGDILMDAATLNVAPTAGVTLRLQAARDVVVRNSSITSTGQALSLDLVAAGSGIGAVEIIGSNITTAGGNITLGGAVSQQLPLPGGGFTAQLYRPAVGYVVLTGAPSITSSAGNNAAAVYNSTLNLGAGTFSATGYTTVDNRDAVSIGTQAGTTVINAGRIDLVGYSSVPSPVNFDIGVYVRGNATDLTATAGITIEGGGRQGVEISDGARVALNAAVGSGAVFSVLGRGSDDAGVAFASDDFNAGTGGRGTRITVNNASFDVTGTSLSNFALAMFNNSLVPGPLLDLSNATSATLNGLTGGQLSTYLSDVELALVKNGATRFDGNGAVSLTATSLVGDGGSLSFSGSGHSINASTITSTGAALAIDFATTGASPGGVLLENTIIDTAGGDLRFGAVQIVSSSVLGSTTVAAPWVETVRDGGNYSGSSVPAALWLLGSTIDAGNGRVYGGGAARSSAAFTAGVTLDGSIVRAREISLAGRTEDESGINILGGTYSATRVLSLQSLSSSDGFYSTFIGRGSVLRVIDPTASTGSGLSVQAVLQSAGPALGIEGGDAGTANETTIVVDGGALTLAGTTSGGAGSTGMQLLGTSAAPGGLLINALGATDVNITAVNAGSDGNALKMAYMNLLGPQGNAGSQLNITASGGITTAPSTTLTDVTLSSGGAVRLVADGLAVSNSRLSGEAGLALLGNTGSPTGAPVSIAGSSLAADGAGAVLRIDASSGGAGTLGIAGFDAGQGITVLDSDLQAAGSGGRVVLNGRGSDTGGNGVVLRRTPVTASDIDIRGRGVVDGDGIVLGDASSATLTTLTATNLTLTGFGADSTTSLTHVGVRLDGSSALVFGGRGAALLSGDSVLLGDDLTALQPVLVSGDAASFTVSTTGSMRVRNATLDFTGGAGTAVTLRSDSDATLNGRTRIESSAVFTGGGDFTITGGTGAAVGVHTFDPAGNALSNNTTLAEGASGVLFAGSSVTIDAGAGTVNLAGQAATDGRPNNPAAAGTWGFNVSSSAPSSITAGSINLVGNGGDKGTGIEVGVTTPGAVLNLQAGAISVIGQGVGVDPNNLTPLPGVVVNSASTWLVTGGGLAITTLASPLVLSGLALSGAGISLDAGGALALQGSTLAATGALSATATGAPVNGSLFSINTSTLTAGSTLNLDATATAPGVALSLLTGVNITGGSVSLAGTASGATSNAPGISAVAASGSITATSGPLDITGRNPALDTEGILLQGPWVLQAPNVINIVSDGTTLLRSPPGFAGSPILSAGQAVNLTLNSPFGITLGNAASALDAGTLATALAGLPATATFTLTVPDPSGLSVAAAFSLPARLQLRAAQIDITPTGRLISSAAGDAIVLGGFGGSAITAFDNQAGPVAFSAGNGRWVLQLQDPASANLGGLGGDFTAYNLAAAPWAVDTNGNLVTPAAGNAIGYAVATSALTGTALGGLLNKVYDASAGITLDPLAWTVNGLLLGDTLALSGATAATMADKNVGTGKAVTLNPASVFTVSDAAGNPVFGYGLPVFTATVTPATLVLGGTVAANKVYDAGVVATLANAGSITPLAGDVVGLGAATASFANKNVGSAKPVTLSGLALTGADAGNYTLSLPTGLVADITPLAVAVTGLTANSKVYDATPLATLSGTAAVGALAGDSVLLSGSAAASFADKNVGTAKTVTLSGLTLSGTDAGNYALVQPAGFTANITPLALALTGLSANSKVYDASTVAALVGAAGIAPLAGDVVTLTGTAAGSFGDKNVGANKPVGISGLTLAGTDAGNYQLTPPVGLNASITPAPLPVFGMSVADKVYDGTLNAPVTGTASVTPLGADVVGVATISASFGDKNVGTNKLVGYTGVTLSGPDAGNYVPDLPVGALADITPRPLPVTGLTANSKVYDGTPLATLSGSAAVGALAGDSVLLAGSAAASFGDKNVGTAKAVTVAGLTLSGIDAGNYALTQPAGLTANISPLALALTGLTPTSKVYDGNTVAPLVGTAAIAPLAGDLVTLAGSAVGSFGDKNVGANKLVAIGGLTLAGVDAANYQLSPPVGANASITPATLTLVGLSAANKVYDATTAASATATLGGVLAGDSVTLALTAAFADANAGTAKTVGYTSTTAGVDAANYTLAAASGSTTADITRATLSYVADAVTLRAGGALPVLTGSVTGFVGGETLAGATTGTLAFTAAATGGSPAGIYAINGGGLAALNYQFVQAAGNATALTLNAAASADPATTANQVSLMLALMSVQVPLVMSSPTEGRVLDVTPAFALGADGSDGEGLSFRAVNFSLMPRDEVQSLLAARSSYKKKIFATSLSKLELDPALADVPACKTEAELETGNCLVTEALKKEIETIAARAVARPRKADRRAVRQAALPTIERKLALLIGINKYDDKRVPELGGAVPDARAVRDLLENRLGYETTVIENPRRETIVRAFNKLAMDAGANDSVVIYYAGHGEVVPVNGVDTGYWLPADVNPDEPKTWMSNSDIARMVGAIGARQMMLISDSCYSGTLAGSEKVQLDQRTNADELLKRKAAVVLSSGGNEPVADEGRDGHSVFAWHFMRAIEGVDQWQVGTNVFERVRAAVVKDFPQTPQYGASRPAGHQGNTDYLFEHREFEATVPVPVPVPSPVPSPRPTPAR